MSRPGRAGELLVDREPVDVGADGPGGELPDPLGRRGARRGVVGPDHEADRHLVVGVEVGVVVAAHGQGHQGPAGERPGDLEAGGGDDALGGGRRHQVLDAPLAGPAHLDGEPDASGPCTVQSGCRLGPAPWAGSAVRRQRRASAMECSTSQAAVPLPVAYWILKVVLSPGLLPAVAGEGRGPRAHPRPRPGRAGRQPPVVLRLVLPPPGAAAPGDLRGQGRVLRQLADGLVLPGRRPDPHAARAEGTPPSGPSTRPWRCSTPADLLGIYPEGTRAPDPRLHKGHTGVARLALRLRRPDHPGGHRRHPGGPAPGEQPHAAVPPGDRPVRPPVDLSAATAGGHHRRCPARTPPAGGPEDRDSSRSSCGP